MLVEAYKWVKVLNFNIAQSLTTQPFYLKQNYTVHYVTDVKFCIPTLFLGSYYGCRFFWNVYYCPFGLVFDAATKYINWTIKTSKTSFFSL